MSRLAYVAKTFDTVAVYFRRVDAARTIFRHSGLPATRLRRSPHFADTGVAARGCLLALVGRLVSSDFVAGPHISDPAQGMAGRAAFSLTGRVHLFTRPPADLRRHLIEAERRRMAGFGLNITRRISTRLPVELRVVEPDLLDYSARKLCLRLLPALPGGTAQSLAAGNAVGAVATCGAENATPSAFSLQHAAFDLGVDARRRGSRRPDDRPFGRISTNDAAKFRRA